MKKAVTAERLTTYTCIISNTSQGSIRGSMTMKTS